MLLDAASLADDVGLLKTMLVAADVELEQLRMQVARLRRMAFGRSSERLTREAHQLELGLEEAEAEAAATVAPAVARARDAAKPYRQPLPDDLPREDVVHEPPCTCPDCGDAMRRMGEDVTEQLDYVPASFRVTRHVRPRLSCRSCERIVQAPLPSMPIERGRPGAGLLAHVLVSKYADHLPLYRQSGIYARHGVELARSTLADWVGRSASLLDPLVDALERHVMGGSTLHADDTPVPVLAHRGTLVDEAPDFPMIDPQVCTCQFPGSANLPIGLIGSSVGSFSDLRLCHTNIVTTTCSTSSSLQIII